MIGVLLLYTVLFMTSAYNKRIRKYSDLRNCGIVVRMRERCVPGSFSPARKEPEYEAMINV